MATQLQLRGYSVQGADSRIALRAYSIGGIDVTRLALSGFTIGGITAGLTASDNAPQSGQRVAIVYAGAGGTVTWRQISGPAAVLTPDGSNCTVLMPIITDVQNVVIGATDTGQAEKTITLQLQAAVQYVYDSATTKRPVATYLYP